ncbi:tRNA (N(6)-L-threonylcarbamoyladenosine(37)-C(2))-methylthiotransferase MtaB [Clostridium algoriphilum]|uniref:tRNA (N(6)-L-threonylcarbamoyladenosine(37)-C(2))- methylthiotransferase MtaB n=1 Tax=Clostridium algoriphilum TaxID=198347 RepID=UPI001CF3F7A4|nr:tRNA (N(6)-L-threonylcarbamoyladenosine(37)-C(2))-methylthiotransferase MtaB [Clostridium algoriphilum]MCB2292561.1 tRNA (N(6)-L-threonylcarbamoyladenosine(37)-C(2))-methylthiotransferase MtaB [Clostridium algoriphilum]
MKVAITTLGCRVNQYESEAMVEKFIKDGYEVTEYDEVSDVYVINTCTVTNMGDKKSRQMIRRARRLNDAAVIAVVGCYAQIAATEVASIDGVDVVLGSRNKGDIVYWVNRYREEKKQVIEVSDVLKNKVFENLNIKEYKDRTRAFVKIQDGCNRFCSYCLIPYARGAVCSKKPEKIVSEVYELAANGFKEILLSGIHIASFGLDLEGGWNLVRVLEEVDKVPGIERIRIGSIDPTFFTEGVIEKIKSFKKLCHHFHLSLQSGCDETLKRMNRHYTAKEYKSVVENIRSNIEGVSITTDVIVGFPGESQEEFDKTYAFLKDLELSKMHIFKYSPRKGTKAAQIKKQIDGNIKEDRSHKLIALNNILEKKHISEFKGKCMNVLYELKSPTSEDEYEGYTDNYIKVMVKAKQNIECEFHITKFIECKDDHLIGEVQEL